MEIILAKSAGFCFGVKEAMDAVNKALKEYKGKNIYTYGPIIHNEIVIKDLEAKGVRIIDGEDELRKLSDPDALIIIRAHGVSERIMKLIEEKSGSYIDATCPFVKRIHKLVREKSREGYDILIAGSEYHPEVQGIMGWCERDVYVLESLHDLEGYIHNIDNNPFLVAQTTFNHKKFKDLVEIFEKKYYNSSVANTICNATHERQEEAASIASRVDAMLVIGGQGSSNTAKLKSICEGLCERTYFLQTADDLPESLPTVVKSVGITAGASTPQFIIEEVYHHVGTNF